MRFPAKAFPAVFIAVLLFTVLSCLDPVTYPENNSQDGTQNSGSEITPITISADIQPVNGKEHKELITTSDFLGVITWDPPLPADKKFEPFKDYTAVISLAMMGGLPLPPAGTKINVEGALSAVYSAGKITAVFPRTHYPVDSVAQLNTAVGAVQPLPVPANPASENIIELTHDFYDDANSATGTNSGAFITVGADEADNDIPYTIRGLGGLGKYSAEKLNVGILLANNNVTLEDLRIYVTDKDKGIPKIWEKKGDGSMKNSYRAAMVIGRYQNAPALGSETFASGGAQSKNVTVQNCNITFTNDTSMIAGIMVLGGDSPVENISITDNEVTVDTRSSSYATQALLIYNYAPTLSITGNAIEALNVATDHVKPASALFMQIKPGFVENFTGTPLISGNTINGSPTYDFYINIYSKGDRIGVPELLNNGFATPDSVWMTADSTDTGNDRGFYKKLIETLLPQTRSGLGYGYLAMYFGGSTEAPVNSDCVFEAYHRKSSRLYAIDFWGYTIDNGAYNESGTSAVNERRARLLLDENGRVYKNNEQFCWYPGDTTGTNMP
jgi:hypothetical protein